MFFAPRAAPVVARKGPVLGVLLIAMVSNLLLWPRSAAADAPAAAETTGDVVFRGGAAGATKRRWGVGGSDGRMPCLFSADEGQYDRYAACLAATEGLRRMRDRAMAEETQGGKRPDTEAEQHIKAQYLLNSGKMLHAMGMSVSKFNAVGREVSRDARLKEKVMEQAYLYRMLASVNMDRMPVLEDPESAKLIHDYRRAGAGGGDKVQSFCDSVAEIEKLRSDQMERLKKALRVDRFPTDVSISDPGLMPFLSPKVRAVVEAFPLQAEEIVKNHGLQSDEFNRMLREAKSNPMFRWKVQKRMKKAGSSSSNNNNGDVAFASDNNNNNNSPSSGASF